MTKWEWESELNRLLTRLSIAERERALGYYQELFADKAEAGMREEQIIAEFGNPADVAEQILAEYRYDVQAPVFEQSPVKDRPKTWPTDGDERAQAADEEKASQKKRGLFGFGLSDLQVWKPSAPLRGLRVCTEGKVTVVRGDQTKVEYYESDYHRYTFSCENGIATVQYVEERPLPKLVLFGLNACGFEKLAVKITLPRELNAELVIETKNGKVRVSEGTFGNLSVQTTNGALCIENVTAENLKAETANGSASVKSVKVGAGSVTTRNGAIDVLDATFARLNAKTTNASVHIDRVCAAGPVSVGSTNGRLTVEKVRAEAIEAYTTNAGVDFGDSTAKIVGAGTTNGSIAVDRITSPDITLKTTNGSVRGTVCGKKADYTILTYTKLGANELPSCGEGAKKLNVSTTLGSIDVRFTED